MNMSNKKDMVKSYYSSVEELKFIKQGFVVEIEKRINGEKLQMILK